jgi:hypothetical protein
MHKKYSRLNGTLTGYGVPAQKQDMQQTEQTTWRDADPQQHVPLMHLQTKRKTLPQSFPPSFIEKEAIETVENRVK